MTLWIWASFSGAILAVAPGADTRNSFPVATQFSPVPSGQGWHGEEGPLTEQVMRDTVDNIIAHGFTGLESDPHRSEEENRFLLDYARARGMFLTAHLGALEGFGREAPPDPSVYSKEYGTKIREEAEPKLASVKELPGLYNMFPFQDEPFHGGPKSFGYSDSDKSAFKQKHGYELPVDLDSIRNTPRQWLDVINFQSDNFPEGWRQVYKIIKEIAPSPKVIMTHDSHNTFGAGFSSHCELAIDDVFHWGGDYADMFVFDIYPYMMFDFRFGECSRLPKPRMSQMHYSFAQMRNLTRANGKELGFWVGTYNPAWFKDYLCPELAAMHWSEREMSATAIAQGANYLLTGYKIPVDPGHWESFGEGLQLIQKAGGRLLKAPKLKARACMLFPRTHMIQMQEEYFNVGLSFELFQRAFGELDILHEEQVIDDSLDGYDVLVLFDAKLLPKEVAERIASFVQKGGCVIADCVPGMDALKEPMSTLEDLFGVAEANTDRIRRSGHWVPYKTIAPIWANRPENPPDESIFETDGLKGKVLGLSLDIPLISPRPCKVSGGEILLKTVSGQPGLVHRKIGKGHAFLLGFCLQDTYFRTWQDENDKAREELRQLLRAMTRTAGVDSHVSSSNPNIEASVRANGTEGFLFIINHEAEGPETVVELSDIGFPIGRILDLNKGEPVTFRRKGNGVRLETSVPLGEFGLFNLLPKP